MHPAAAGGREHRVAAGTDPEGQVRGEARPMIMSIIIRLVMILLSD